MTARVLLLGLQSPLDAGSGAAVSTRHLACVLAGQGVAVRVLSGDGTEGPRLRDLPPQTAAAVGLRSLVLGGAVFEWVEPTRDWGEADEARLDARLDALLADWRPQLVIGYGGRPRDAERLHRARAAGARVLFTVHNLAYLRPELRPALAAADELLLPSAWMAQRYRDAGWAALRVLPPPLWGPEVLAPTTDPVFATFVNPEPAKGVALVARLAARCPTWPLLVVEARGRAAHFQAAARAAGLDPLRWRHVSVSPGGVPPRELMAVTRVLLMPSLVDEAAGRLVAEALVNGVPCLVSDAGALPETLGDGGQVIAWRRDGRGEPLAEDPDTVDAWARALQAWRDPAAWEQARTQARAAGQRWQPVAAGPALRAALFPDCSV